MSTHTLRQSILTLAILAFAPAAPAKAHEVKPTAAAERVELPGHAAEAAATVDAFHAALHAGETERAAALLSDDALVFEAGNAEESKAVYAAGHLAADATFEKAATSALLRRWGQANGEMAWIASEGRTQAKLGDRTLDRLTTESMVLRRTAAGWRIVHVHWSSRPRPLDTPGQ